MTVSELYKILEVLVKENPQGIVHFEDDRGYLTSIETAELDDGGDLLLL